VLIGYGRVSTPEQNPDHQIDALRRAGVAGEDIHIDTASGAKASHPELDTALKRVRAGDQLVITRLDRLGRSVLHLVTLGAQLRERGVGLRVLEQGIDTSTAEGRAMFGMLSVLAELQRELIVANARDGLAAARARGRLGGRRPKLTPAQVATAQRLYDEGAHTVAQIADILKVKRGTLYGHLDKASVGVRPRASTSRAAGSVVPPSNAAAAGDPLRPVPARIRRPDEPITGAERRLRDRLVRQRAAMCASACPTCGNEPIEAGDRWRQRQDLAITWLYPNPENTEQVIERHHCAECQPHQQVATVLCAVCGDGPLLVNDLAAYATDDKPPAALRRWLAGQGWLTSPRLLCPDHPHRT
jgi:DNA invertase Pin-like site-specific DNA recombinase